VVPGSAGTKQRTTLRQAQAWGWNTNGKKKKERKKRREKKTTDEIDKKYNRKSQTLWD
jgi:hypothetical protein